MHFLENLFVHHNLQDEYTFIVQITHVVLINNFLVCVAGGETPRVCLLSTDDA